MITIEEMDQMLDHPSIQHIEAYGMPSDMGFCRCRRFMVRGQEIKIVWHINSISVIVGEVEAHCDGMERDNTWPNRSRLNLQFTLNGRVCVVLALEPLD